MAFIIKLGGTCTDTTLATLERDSLLSGDSGGVRFLFDAEFPFCYVGGAPADGAVITDIAENANGSFVKNATQTIAFNGNGFDFSTMTASAGDMSLSRNNVSGPASVWADIDAYQHFLWCAYMRIPTLSNWNTNAVILPFFASSIGAATGYQGTADPLTMIFHSTPSIQARRQTSVGVATTMSASPTLHYDLVSQVAFWRNATDCGLRVKSAGGTTLVTAASGSDNSADISSAVPQWGSVNPFTSYTLSEHRTGRNYRMYRGFIENLHTSSRDPVEVLDADYSRTIGRAVFS